MRNFAVLALLSIVCLTAVGQERERRAPATAEHAAEGEPARDHEPKPPVAEKEL